MSGETGSAEQLASYLDGLLGTTTIDDSPRAWNGLQVDRSGPIQHIALAVDAAQEVIDRAAKSGADLLIVHHGLFWDGAAPVTGRRYRRLRALISANVGLYSSHLPLDIHPEFGNNAVLARALGVKQEGTFGEHRGIRLGVFGSLDIRREALAARLDQLLGGPVRMIAGGPERVRRVGVITGSAGDSIESAREAGLDAFVTGECAHHNYFDAVEGGVNLYLGGHYATEVWGLQALGQHLQRRFAVECTFIENPTGL